MAEKKFGADTWRCEKLGAEEGIRLLIKSGKVLGPASSLMGAIGEGDKAKAEAMTAQAVAEFVSNLDEEETISFIRELIGLCAIRDARGQSMPAIFGVHCQDMDLGEIFKLCFWILEVQFKSFLGGTLAAGKGRQPAQVPH